MSITIGKYKFDGPYTSKYMHEDLKEWAEDNDLELRHFFPKPHSRHIFPRGFRLF